MNPMPPTDLADVLNRGCACQTLRPDWLRQQLERDPRLQGLHQSLQHSHPHLFSTTVVFVNQSVLTAMETTVAAIQRVTQLPAWQAQLPAPHDAQEAAGRKPQGAFMGFDFHIEDGMPQLIEINTNAGGAFLNAALARAQAACCEAMDGALTPYRDMRALEAVFYRMFLSEWQSQRGDQPLRSVAIVDDAPESQYLSPEFELARAMFEAHGLQARIADARSLRWDGHTLWAGAQAIDMVYNRVTDFDLSDPAHAALSQAWRSGAVVLTPHPANHALQADKRHLQTLTDASALARMGASAADIDTLRQHIPPCVRVSPGNAQTLWEERKRYFFKPLQGFGSRAVYRGDKLTRRVWEEIVAGDYIAQALVPPGQRAMPSDLNASALKYDVRAYAYQGQVQLLAARMYQGQTTNFRTEGGGFAPVVVVRPEQVAAYAEALGARLALAQAAPAGTGCGPMC